MANENLNQQQCVSQRKRILAHLNKGKHLTQLDALYRFGCMRLAARVCELRDQGVKIQMQMIKTPTSKFVADYYIKPEDLPKDNNEK